MLLHNLDVTYVTFLFSVNTFHRHYDEGERPLHVHVEWQRYKVNVCVTVVTGMMVTHHKCFVQNKKSHTQKKNMKHSIMF